MEPDRECSDRRCRVMDSASVHSEKNENSNTTESQAENGMLEMIMSCAKDDEEGYRLFGDE